jgi:hypothetical protein
MMTRIDHTKNFFLIICFKIFRFVWSVLFLCGKFFFCVLYPFCRNASNGACVKEIRIFMPSEICSLEIRSNEELLCSYINHSRNGSFYSHGVSLIDLRTFEQSKLDYQKDYILEAKYGNEISKQIGKIRRDSEDFVEIYTTL